MRGGPAQDAAVAALGAGLDQDLGAVAFPLLANVSNLDMAALDRASEGARSDAEESLAFFVPSRCALWIVLSLPDAPHFTPHPRPLPASNLLAAKFATGLFDDGLLVNLTALNETLDAPPHRALAFQAAAESLVLLQVGCLALYSMSSALLSQEAAPRVPPTTDPRQNSRGVLPLTVSPALRVALIGPNAGCESDAPGLNSCDAINAQLGGYTAYGARVVTLRSALEAAAAAEGFSVTFSRGCNIDDGNLSMIPAAVTAATAADVAVVVLGDSSDGYGHGSCAEGIDADQLDLVGGQLALLNALVTQVWCGGVLVSVCGRCNSTALSDRLCPQAPGTPIVLVGISGRPFTLGAGPSAFTGPNNAIAERLGAILQVTIYVAVYLNMLSVLMSLHPAQAWRPGEEGGNAIWAALAGAVNPSGHLAQVWMVRWLPVLLAHFARLSLRVSELGPQRRRAARAREPVVSAARVPPRSLCHRAGDAVVPLRIRALLRELLAL